MTLRKAVVGEFEENIRMARNRDAVAVDERAPARQIVPGQIFKMRCHPLEPVGRRLRPPARIPAVDETRSERFHTQGTRSVGCVRESGFDRIVDRERVPPSGRTRHNDRAFGFAPPSGASKLDTPRHSHNHPEIGREPS